MKRTLLFLALILLAHGAAAGVLRERDVLLTTGGVLYTVDAVHDGEVASGRSPYHLVMTTQRGADRVTEQVPGTLYGGAHGYPSLAHDPDSDTLFLFWQETLHRGVTSRLLFASYHDGRWSDVTELDSVTWGMLRRNLRIAVTRTIETVTEEGRFQVPQVVVHAVWWEANAYGEFARYAMLGIDQGVVTSSDFRYLIDFTGGEIDKSAQFGSTVVDEVLRHPAVAAAPGRDAVDILFGDADANAMRRLRIKPVLDGRVRIPIGVRGGGMRNAALNVAPDGRAAAVIDDESIALYTVSDGSLDYVVFRNGAWSEQRSIALGNEISSQTAIEALRRMVAAR